jgi:hypothetical protein
MAAPFQHEKTLDQCFELLFQIVPILLANTLIQASLFDTKQEFDVPTKVDGLRTNLASHPSNGHKLLPNVQDETSSHLWPQLRAIFLHLDILRTIASLNVVQLAHQRAR